MSSIKLQHPEGRTLTYDGATWQGHPLDVLMMQLVLLDEKLIEMDPDDFPDYQGGDAVVKAGKDIEKRTVWEIVDSKISPIPKDGVN